MRGTPPVAPRELPAGERTARLAHAALLALLAAGLAAWLWRVYGFPPLRVVEAGTP